MLIYLCPSDKKYSCSWEGPSEDILHHFEEEHDDLLHFSDTFNINLSILSENRLLLIEEEIYLAQIKIIEKQLDIKLRYLGPQKIAEKITYTISLGNNLNSFIVKNGTISIDLNNIDNELSIVTCTLNINKSSVLEDFDDVYYSQAKIEDSLPHMPIPNRKLSLEDRTYKSRAIECSLTRSKTISVDEVKKRNLKRAKSTVSLGAINEIDTDSICTECGVTLVPPIYLCPCEHSFCINCQNIICKICSKKVTFERNISLEERFNKFLVPCRYKKNGCPEKLVYNEITDHIISCTFCDYQCPIAGCHFEGQFKHMCKHLKIIHGATKILEAFIIVFQNIPEAFLVNEERGIFYCCVQYFDDCVKWEAKFCGPKERRFFCELKFKEGKLKQPVLLNRNENTYSIEISLQELKRMKIKAKNSILTIAC